MSELVTWNAPAPRPPGAGGGVPESELHRVHERAERLGRDSRDWTPGRRLYLADPYGVHWELQPGTDGPADPRPVGARNGYWIER